MKYYLVLYPDKSIAPISYEPHPSTFPQACRFFEVKRGTDIGDLITWINLGNQGKYRKLIKEIEK